MGHRRGKTPEMEAVKRTVVVRSGGREQRSGGARWDRVPFFYASEDHRGESAEGERLSGALEALVERDEEFEE